LRLPYASHCLDRGIPVHRLTAHFTFILCLTGGGGAFADPQCDGCLEARYWLVPPVDQSQAFVFPELDTQSSAADADRLLKLPNVGLAFSGGGTRSATAVLGQLRGLRKNGWLQNVRYVSAVSGGAWAAIPFVYSKVRLDSLLGRYEEPSSLRLATIEKEPNGLLAERIKSSSLTAGSIREATSIVASLETERSAGQVLDFAAGLVKGLRRDTERPSKTYSNLLADIFIDPLLEPGERTSSRPFTWDGRAAADLDAATGAELNPVQATADRPYLIAVGTMVSKRLDYTEPILMPVEYTPLYSGVPGRFGGGRFGGTYVSSWAYDAMEVGARTAPDANGRGTIRVKPNRAAFSLADVAASTGAAPELWLVNGGGSSLPEALKRIQPQLTFGASLFPAFRHISLLDAQPFLSSELPHADGGAGDNLGVMPLLARHVDKVLVFINTSTEFVENNTDLRSLFARGGQSASGDKGHNVVFGESRYEEVRLALVRAREQQRPQVYCDSGWEVLPNDTFHVQPYSGLAICFFYNARGPQWEAALDDEPLRWLKTTHGRWHRLTRLFVRERPMTRAELLAKDLNRDHFPWFATFFQNKPHFIKLTTAQVNLLSNLTAWTVNEPGVMKMVTTHMPDIARSPSQAP
jgi:hypothetical protein